MVCKGCFAVRVLTPPLTRGSAAHSGLTHFLFGDLVASCEELQIKMIIHYNSPCPSLKARGITGFLMPWGRGREAVGINAAHENECPEQNKC